MKPRMFIGSSVEGKEIAEYLQLGLDHDVETTIWHQGIFGLSEGSLESLVRAAKDFDFAALVLTPDDLVTNTKRGTEKDSPRDNVVFELGLFMGALGRERTFIVYNRDKKPDLPSDLAGVTPATFANRSDNNLRAAVGPVCTQIKDAIKACGLKAGHAAEPAVKTEPSTVVVDRQDKGDYATITEALKAVEPGSRIFVRPGIYSESVVIDKPVDIVGDGDRNEIVLQAYGEDIILFRADKGRISNLALRKTGYSKGYCINITQGRVEIEDCDISSQGEACVVIHSSADPRLRRNCIHNGQIGIFVYKNGQGRVEDNEIIDNSRTGMTIMTGGNPVLRGNCIARNSYVGIEIHSNGGGIFEDNDLRGNAEGAWYIAPDCEARVQRSGNKE